MKNRTLVFLTIVSLQTFQVSGQSKEVDSKSPNIIYILADDLGYGDIKSVNSEGNLIVLNGEVAMKQDNIEFQQLVHIDAGNGKLVAQDDGSIIIHDTSDVTIYLSAYSDYLPVYPSFKGRDYKADTKKTLDVAVKMGYENLKKAHE